MDGTIASGELVFATYDNATDALATVAELKDVFFFGTLMGTSAGTVYVSA